MSESQDARSSSSQGGEEQDSILQSEYDGGICAGFGEDAPRGEAGYELTSVLAQYKARQERRPSSVAAQGHVHSSTASMPGIRATERQSLRAHQAKPIPWPQHDTCKSLRATITQRTQSTQQSTSDTL